MSTSDSCRVSDPAPLRRWMRFWRWILAVVLVAGCVSDVSMDGFAAARAPAGPAALRAAHIAAVQARAPEAYRGKRSGDEWVATNLGQGFTAEFTAAGVMVATHEGKTGEGFSLSLERYGCEGDLRPVTAAEPEAA